jgi:formylglycine-generating enzyme
LRRALGGKAVTRPGCAALCLIAAAAFVAAGLTLHGAGTVDAAKAKDMRLCQSYDGLPPAGLAHLPGSAPTDMVWVLGGTFAMGSDDAFREERPVRQVTVDGFWIDRHEVTNSQFALFVAQTGYKTVAERGLDPKSYPDIPAELIVPGSIVFDMPKDGDSMDPNGWWRFLPGADWRHPDGPQSTIAGRENHPVVHIAYRDAEVYAAWLGRGLPSEAEWEFAARGGLDRAAYAWGNAENPQGKWMANSWQGIFPYEDDEQDGYHGSAPVGCFPPNGYGLFDMTGNVWEWAADHYEGDHLSVKEGALNPAAADREAAAAAALVHVIKGGSWLCSPNFCGRYRPSARQPQEADLGAIHIGFRTVLRASPPSQ